MRGNPKLKVSWLYEGALVAFRRQPGLCIGMYAIYVAFWSLGGTLFSMGPGDQDVVLSYEVRFGDGVVRSVAVVLLFFCVGAISGGYDLAMLRLQRGDSRIGFRALLVGFRKFWNLSGIYLIRFFAPFVFFTGGFLLAVPLALVSVPAYVIFCTVLLFFGGLSGAFMLGTWTSFLLALEDDLKPIEALQRSWHLIDGFKSSLIPLALTHASLFALTLAVAGVIYRVLLAFSLSEMMAQSAAILSGLIGWLVLGSLSQLAWIDAYRELRGAADGDNSASP